MEKKEKSDIQRWSIVNIWVDNLPYELRNVELSEWKFNIDDYSNWNVFWLNYNTNPKKYSQYPSLYKFLSEWQFTWFWDDFLILQKQLTPELQEQAALSVNKACEILNILIENVKKAWWKREFQKMAQEYRDEIVSIFKDYSWEVVDMLWNLVEWYKTWEITEEDIDGLSDSAELIKFKPIENNMFCYIKWIPKEIDELKNRFLDWWSNIFVVK